LQDGRHEKVHADLAIKAQELALQKKTVTDILKELTDYVQDEIFYQQVPNQKRRRYNPSRRDIQNFIQRMNESAIFFDSELKELQEHFAELDREDPERNLYFECQNPPVEVEEDFINNSKKKRLNQIDAVSQFVLVHQSTTQQHLLHRYGQFAYLVEVIPNANVKWALFFRMFLLVVRTNVDHQTVGTFLFNKYHSSEEDESDEDSGLQQALSQFKEMNSFWKPKYLLVDATDELSSVVSELFPGLLFST